MVIADTVRTKTNASSAKVIVMFLWAKLIRQCPTHDERYVYLIETTPEACNLGSHVGNGKWRAIGVHEDNLMLPF